MNKWTAATASVSAIAAAGVGIFAIWAFAVRDEAPSRLERQERSEQQEAVEIAQWFHRLTCESVELEVGSVPQSCREPEEILGAMQLRVGAWIVRTKGALGDRCLLIEPKKFRPISATSLTGDVSIYDQLSGIELVTC